MSESSVRRPKGRGASLRAPSLRGAYDVTETSRAADTNTFFAPKMIFPPAKLIFPNFQDQLRSRSTSEVDLGIGSTCPAPL